MNSIINEKLAICYCCCGPTYRESAKRQLNETYFDDDNIYYCVLTDDKSYFDDVKRKNLIVNELKDFYSEFPALEKNEFFLESTDKFDYAEKFTKERYLFSFSSYRFNLLQAIRLGINNVALLCTDTNIKTNVLDSIKDLIFQKKPYLYNAVSQWWENIENNNIPLITKILKEKYDLTPNNEILIIDAAARLFVGDEELLTKFFNIWNNVVEQLYESGDIRLFKGSYVINDEYILAPIYDVLNMTRVHDIYSLFNVQHDMKNERFWLV
jgi:hypothetical protein